MGRPPIGEKAMTGLERLHRFRERQRQARPETKHETKHEAGEIDALRRDNAALREQIAQLTRERDEARAQAAARQPPEGQATLLFNRLAASGKERDRLARENEALKAASRVSPDEVAPVAKLMREIDTLKAKLAKAEANPDEQVAALQKQLKAARARINHFRAESARAWQAAKANPVAIAKADHVKLIKVFHPDGEARVSKAREAQLTEAFQIFNALKLNIFDKL
jgi:hypothetical protein